MSKAKPSPNDQRSNVKNGNNQQYQKDKANTAKQVKENTGGKGKK